MPILDPNAVEFFSRSPDQTRRLGIRLGAMLKPGDLVCLTGDLGSGKTTFVQGLAKGWGTLDSVTSPTFVLVNVYGRPDGFNLFHLDAYRMAGPAEAEDLDIDLILETGALVVEWPERIQSALPDENLTIEMRWIADEQRFMHFVPNGARFEEIVKAFRTQAFGGGRAAGN